jgi:hypothetical protein
MANQSPIINLTKIERHNSDRDGNSTINRRRMLTMGTALAIANVSTVSAVSGKSTRANQSYSDSRLLELGRRWKESRELECALVRKMEMVASTETKALDDQIHNQCCRRFEIKDLIMEQPSFTAAGLAVKLEVGGYYVEERDTHLGWAQALLSVQEDVARLLTTQAKEAA